MNEKPSQEAGFGEEQDNRGKGHMRREGQWLSPSSAGEQRLTEESWGIIIARHIHVAETKKKEQGWRYLSSLYGHFLLPVQNLYWPLLVCKKYTDTILSFLQQVPL